MTDLTGIINKNSSVSMVDAHYENLFEQRRRLGLSQAGHECKRFLWYKHHGYDEPVPDGRVLRLFQLGNILEDQIVIDLKDAGYKVWGTQDRIKFNHMGVELTGSCDGKISGLVESKQEHLLEIKTMGSKGFKKLLKDGYEAYNEQYKFQIHAYALGLELTNILTVVYNKDTSELYQERIKIKKEWIINQLADVFSAITMDQAPERLCPRPDWWKASWCPFYNTCFKGVI